MFDAVFERLERTPPAVLLLINAALGVFVLVAHGGALLLVLTRKVPVPPGYEELVRTMVPFTLPIAALMVLGSGLAVVWKAARTGVLRLQAVIVLISGAALLVWAIGLILNGIPEGNFAWTPGLLTGWVAYGT